MSNLGLELKGIANMARSEAQRYILSARTLIVIVILGYSVLAGTYGLSLMSLDPEAGLLPETFVGNKAEFVLYVVSFLTALIGSLCALIMGFDAFLRDKIDGVEDLLFTGFLSHQVQVAGADLSLRSFSPGDTFLLRHRVGNWGSERNWKVWCVASSIWMVDGVNLLPYPHAINHVYHSVAALPGTTLDILFSVTMGLYARVSMAIRRTEAYCYEAYSRANWRLSCNSHLGRVGEFTITAATLSPSVSFAILNNRVLSTPPEKAIRTRSISPSSSLNLVNLSFMPPSLP